MCVDYNKKELDKLRDELSTFDKNNNKKAFFYVCDITSTDQVKTVSDQIRKEVGDVTLLVNNAGMVNSAKLLLELKQEEITRLFQVHKC